LYIIARGKELLTSSPLFPSIVYILYLTLVCRATQASWCNSLIRDFIIHTSNIDITYKFAHKLSLDSEIPIVFGNSLVMNRAGPAPFHSDPDTDPESNSNSQSDFSLRNHTDQCVPVI
jgi:hypothetical protein